MSRNFNFPTHLRLKSRKKIDELFSSRLSLLSHPILFKYSFNPKDSSNEPQVAFSLKRKNFKRAVDRNRIKRLMREAYRLNWRNDLESIINKGDLSIIFIYIDDKIQSYLNIESSLKKVLQKLAIQTTKQLESPEKKS